MSHRNALIGGTSVLWLGLLGSTAAFAAETDNSLQAFGAALQAAGWQVEVLVDGSLQLTPGNRAVQTVDPVVTKDSTGAPLAGIYEATADAAGWQTLRRLGWRIETDADGATLLFPPSSVPASEPETPTVAADTSISQPEVDEAPSQSSSAQDELAQDLDALFAQRGWRSQHQSDGSLLLMPLRRASADAVGIQPAAGFIPAVVTEGQIQLPVDNWRKARAVATSWLDAYGDDQLRLGKLRRVLRVYVVSIVERMRPAALRHQLAIGVDDGRVVVLN
jgi:hypothetical protein